MPPPPRPRNSASGRGPGATPMSERQQMALLMQMTSSSNDAELSPNSQSNRVKDRNERGETPLHIAAKKGDFEAAKKLLEQGTNPNVTDFAGWTPLHEAANHGHYHVAQILVKHGANVMTTGLDDMTPLHDAAAVGNQKLVKLLIDKGADLNFKNKKGKTPQDIAHASLANFFSTLTGEMANNKQQQQQQQQTQKKTEVKKSNTDEDSSNAMASNSSTQAAPSDVYEFVSTPKHSSCSSGDENPIKSFDKSSLDDKSGTDSDTQMTSSAANATATSSCAQQQKRTLGDQQDRNEDNLSPAEEDSKRKKRKDSEFPLSSSQAGTNTNAKPSLISGTNRVTSRVGIKPPGPASKTMGLINKGSDRKSPCESPKITMSSSKSPADSTHSTDADNEELTKNSSDSGPKVPPLKIVIPQQQAPSQPTQQMQPQNPGNSNETQDQQGSSIQRTSIKGGVASRNISSTSSSSLPYVLNASSNSNDSTSNDKQESLVIASTSVASPMTESNKSMNEDGKQVGGKSKEPRVLRSSQRSGKDSKDDRSSNNSSPQLPVSSTPSPAAHNSGDSSSAGTESEGNGQQGMNVTSSTTPATLNVSNQLPSTSNSTISSQQQAQNQQNQPQTSSSSSSQTSVDLHPRKRKIKPSSSKEQQPTSSTSSSANAMVTSSSSAIDTKDSNSKDGSDKTQGSESTHPHDQPFSNCYQMYIDLRKQIDQRHRNLQPIEPRPLKGLEDYLMNRRTYSLHGKPPMEPNLIIPPLLPNQMKETFFEQEKERHKLKMRHIVEKEKLVLSKEQEILRVHCKAAQIQANQTQPFSVCTILKDEEVYNPISPEHEERYNNRSFFKELKDLDDKWDKIKEAMIIRHTNEAESLHAVQAMDWGWKLKEYLLCDYKATPEIEELHVPMVDVSDEYTTPSIKN